MKLYVLDNGNKKYIKARAANRKELADQIGKSFKIDDKNYSVMQVRAEQSNDNAAASMIIGGFIGLLGGVTGAIAGSAIGGIIGNEKDKKEMTFVESFNNSEAK
ncbi:TPA: hypothetical protein RVS02_001525 [Aeromonas veronii]|uniref:hypothetical protein n=1 Tax=Aeromonas veronii TaxID=654 RepID=UPI0022300C89|nr:hypothetical protein [Aeromonas veronii]EKP0299942.1 hypothetical protein [Aeromonas veronii]UZE60174.1 hypothetical protein ONR73_02700 [Aeromonas veronii]HEA3200013.1 hypothetical protein [Aeromonas veronii]